jgi:hypothetical protein
MRLRDVRSDRDAEPPIAYAGGVQVGDRDLYGWWNHRSASLLIEQGVLPVVVVAQLRPLRRFPG